MLCMMHFLVKSHKISKYRSKTILVCELAILKQHPEYTEILTFEKMNNQRNKILQIASAIISTRKAKLCVLKLTKNNEQIRKHEHYK